MTKYFVNLRPCFVGGELVEVLTNGLENLRVLGIL